MKLDQISIDYVFVCVDSEKKLSKQIEFFCGIDGHCMASVFLTYPELSTAFCAYSTWNILPSGDNVEAE